jgi:hypothetical protein
MPLWRFSDPAGLGGADAGHFSGGPGSAAEPLHARIVRGRVLHSATVTTFRSFSCYSDGKEISGTEALYAYGQGLFLAIFTLTKQRYFVIIVPLFRSDCNVSRRTRQPSFPG